MECLNCGAELHKNDIFCINCEAPVLTDDDLVALANMEPDEDSDILQDTINMSASGKLFDSLSLKSNSTDNENNNGENGEPEKIIRKRSTNNKAIIITAAIVLAVVAGFVLFLIFRPPSGTTPGSDPGSDLFPGTTPPVNDTREEPDPNENNLETPPDVIYTVSTIAILNSGRVQTEFHVGVGESVLLTSQLVPDGAVADVTWSSSDPEIIEVTQSDSSGAEATITGIAPGVADIIVSADGIEVIYYVEVDNLPVTAQFENALNNENLPIWLTISWLCDDKFGQEIVFERNKDNQLWTMESAAERGDISPTFHNINGVITIHFPDTEEVYHLFDDSTGYLGTTPDNPENEDFMWWFKTTLVEPEG